MATLTQQLVRPALETVDRRGTRRSLRLVISVVALADTTCLAAAVLLGWSLRLRLDGLFPQDVAPGDGVAVVVGPWILVAWLLMLLAHGAYSPRHFSAGPEEFRSILRASLVTAGLVGLACYLVHIQPSRGFVALSFLLGVVLLVGERFLVRKLVHRARARGGLRHRVVAVGGPSGINEVAAVLDRERYVGYHVVGACLPAEITAGAADELDVPHLGDIADLRERCDELGADTVLVARGAYSSSDELRRIAWALEGGDIEMVVVPSLTDIAGPRISMRPVAGLPLLHVEQPQAGEAGGLPKRAFDVLASAGLLVLLSPVMLAVAAVVNLHDGGPVFFRQPRVGRSGDAFGMLKFRSMVVDAEIRLDDVRHLNESDGVLFKVRNDPRVTTFGRFIRRFSVDELPQLFNVLRGQMSLVGPRPPLPAEVASYESDVRRRLMVRPGMTGLWQVSGRSELSWKESVRLDLYYVDNWSMMTDLVIMAKTVRAVLGSSGAY